MTAGLMQTHPSELDLHELLQGEGKWAGRRLQQNADWPTHPNWIGPGTAGPVGPMGCVLGAYPHCYADSEVQQRGFDISSTKEPVKSLR